jgi:hypothetical protein
VLHQHAFRGPRHYAIAAQIIHEVIADYDVQAGEPAAAREMITLRGAVHLPHDISFDREAVKPAGLTASVGAKEMTFMGNRIQVKHSLANHTEGKQAEGKATGKLVFIGRRETTLPLDLVTQESDMPTLEVLQASMVFEGRLRKDANQIAGSFQQGPVEAELVLRRQ